MTFEIAIATMHKTKVQCLEMLAAENIHCDCIIVDQCDEDGYAEENVGGQHIRIFFTTERGLSKSRNMALRNMKADIMAIGDDDLYYYDGFDKMILSYYERNRNADAVLFNMDDYNKVYPDSSKQCCFLELSGYKSIQTTFRSSLHGHKPIQTVSFNEYFGTGSAHVQSGEENIFLADLWRAGARIYYCKDKIVRREETESSWFKGYTEAFLKDRGAIYYAMSRFWYGLYVFRYTFKIRKKIRPISIGNAIMLMRQGRKDYVQHLHSLDSAKEKI